MDIFYFLHFPFSIFHSSFVIEVLSQPSAGAHSEQMTNDKWQMKNEK